MSTTTPPSPTNREARIIEQVTAWPGITTATGEFGETEFYVEGRTIGHVHGADMADIPFPRALKEELVADGRTGPHHIYPESGWTTRYIRGDHDVDEVVALLRINYERIVPRDG